MKALLTFLTNPFKLKLLRVLWDHLINKNIFSGPRLKNLYSNSKELRFLSPTAAEILPTDIMKALLTFLTNPFKLKLLWVLWDHLINKNIFFRPIGAFFLLKLKIPIQNRAKIGPQWKIFSVPWSIDFKGPRFYTSGTMPDRMVNMPWNQSP